MWRILSSIHWYPDNLFASAASRFNDQRHSHATDQHSRGGSHGQMGIAATETGAGNNTGSPAALFAADNFLTWIENGAINVDYRNWTTGSWGIHKSIRRCR